MFIHLSDFGQIATEVSFLVAQIFTVGQDLKAVRVLITILPSIQSCIVSIFCTKFLY